MAPENTLPAFRSAILKGGDRIELDVQMTSDGVVVVTHDSNLKRCTGKNAKVYDLTYAEVAQLDAGRWFSSRFADTRIPTLEQVLQLCRGRIGLNVEIKPSAATPALEAETAPAAGIRLRQLQLRHHLPELRDPAQGQGAGL